MEKNSIRFATSEDAMAIASVHVASWQEIYKVSIPNHVLTGLSVEKRAQEWHELIDKGLKILVIEKNNSIVGFASINPSRDADTNPHTCGEISAIYLHPSVWRQGLGKQLCLKALSELENMGFTQVILWVLQVNNQARKFYESLGFINTNKTKKDAYDKDIFLNEVRYQKKFSNPFSFKSMQESDFDLLCKWLDKPHVKEWWTDGLTHEEIKSKYKERIGDTTVLSFIINFHEKPIGFIQYYYANKVGEGWWPNETEGTVGIDQYIGEENYINQGYGTKLIRAFIHQLFSNPAIKKIIVDVDPNNHRAIRCYEKSGFKFVKELNTPDGMAYLMEQYRA